nr:MAG TPA: hypothetical protein [Caudoviricetes sp.]DAT32695.1 MAG TPA: hypothetical protein [Caudoviricetes sp.]
MYIKYTHIGNMKTVVPAVPYGKEDTVCGRA